MQEKRSKRAIKSDEEQPRKVRKRSIQGNTATLLESVVNETMTRRLQKQTKNESKQVREARNVGVVQRCEQRCKSERQEYDMK